MLTVPEPEGVLQVIVVLFNTRTEVAATPPKVTVAPLRNPVPVIVTEVFPPTAPAVGDTEVGLGAAWYVYPLDRVPI